jgi:Pyridoxamine 5'-phosphate oxidase
MDTPGERIPSQRCWELLATASVGRLALSVRALPVILPVQYYVTGHRLTVCLGHQAIPERSLNDAIIAFTADAIDPVTRSGWSVQIQGRSSISRHGGFNPPCGHLAAAQVVELEPGTISGYRVHLCPFIDALLAGPPSS